MQDKGIIFISGCMYSGKSTFLVDTYVSLKTEYPTLKIEAFKPFKNKRGGEFIVSRARSVKIPCHMITNPQDILEYDADIYLCDEYQVFEHDSLRYVLKQLKEKGKLVYIAGLDKKAVNEYWTNYKMVEGLADRLIQLRTKCKLCSALAEVSTLVKFGNNKSFSTTQGAEYENLCDKHSQERSII